VSVASPPLSLYIHVPWCVRKCPYCDFNSHQRPAQLPEARYVAALLADLADEAPLAAGRPLQSIFLGGGTPSLFSGAAIRAILDGVRAELQLTATAEITLETNPGAAEFDRLEGYREAGVNRLSFGVQSFHDPALKRLGRIHDGSDARRAFALARSAGFDNINIDLMYALPAQTVDEALADVAQAVELAPEHLSHYQLTLEPGTVFARFPPSALPDDELLMDMQEATQAAIAAAGFEQYEVSAYARPGRRSAHNLNYWLFGDYLAIGAGAHSKTTDADGIRRRVRVRNPNDYLNSAVRVAEDKRVPAHELPFEYLLNALRLREGFDASDYLARVGQSIDSPPFQRALQRGWLERHGDRIRASDVGYRFLNDVISSFLSDP
jgi:oxygen-independent coproporphyrinogen-3 oxidase